MENAIACKENKNDEIQYITESALGFYTARKEMFSTLELTTIKKRATKFIESLNSKRKKLIPQVENNEPSNKNIEKQMHFTSKKKKTQVSSSSYDVR